MDAIVQVVRCFEDADIHHVTGSVDPVRDIEIINTELVLADLEACKNAVDSIAKDAKRGDKDALARGNRPGKNRTALNAGKPALTFNSRPRKRPSRGLFPG